MVWGFHKGFLTQQREGEANSKSINTETGQHCWWSLGSLDSCFMWESLAFRKVFRNVCRITRRTLNLLIVLVWKREGDITLLWFYVCACHHLELKNYDNKPNCMWKYDSTAFKYFMHLQLACGNTNTSSAAWRRKFMPSYVLYVSGLEGAWILENVPSIWIPTEE